MKLPDFFYIKQTRALNNLHDFSVNRLASFYKRNNPQNAYDSEWGMVQLESLTNSILLSHLKPEVIARILRQKTQPNGFTSRPELDRDIAKVEIIQANLEWEIDKLISKKLFLALLAFLINSMAILACELIQLTLP